MYYILFLLILIFFGIIHYPIRRFERRFNKDVVRNLLANNPVPDGALSESDMESLPSSVQRYLRYVGAVNQPKVKNEVYIHLLIKNLNFSDI